MIVMILLFSNVSYGLVAKPRKSTTQHKYYSDNKDLYRVTNIKGVNKYEKFNPQTDKYETNNNFPSNIQLIKFKNSGDNGRLQKILYERTKSGKTNVGILSSPYIISSVESTSTSATTPLKIPSILTQVKTSTPIKQQPTSITLPVETSTTRPDSKNPQIGDIIIIQTLNEKGVFIDKTIKITGYNEKDISKHGEMKEGPHYNYVVLDDSNKETKSVGSITQNYLLEASRSNKSDTNPLIST